MSVGSRMSNGFTVFISSAHDYAHSAYAKLIPCMNKLFALKTAQAVSVLTGTAKNITGTGKDVVDITKGRLEIKALEEKLSPIHLASFEDVKEFDPKFRKIQNAVKRATPLLILFCVLGTSLLQTGMPSQLRLLMIFVCLLIVITLIQRALRTERHANL